MSTIVRTRATSTRRISELIDPSETLYRLTVDEFERLGDVLKNQRVELVDGMLVAKMTKKPPHVVACDLTRSAIDNILPRGWHTRGGDPVRIPRYNEPEPDVALVRGKLRDYSDHHPGPRDVALVVEVADTSLAKDRLRARIYGGKARIPVYWIINLIDRHVEVYTGPRSNGYSSRIDYPRGAKIPVVIDGVVVGQIAVADILPCWFISA
jgi:Uma2 family endonuclease